MSCPDCRIELADVPFQGAHAMFNDARIVYCSRHTPARVARLEEALETIISLHDQDHQTQLECEEGVLEKCRAALHLPRTP